MRLSSFLLSATAALLAGCMPGVCTEIGCEDGLTVRFDAPPAGAFRMEAVVLNHGGEYAFDCPDATTCFTMFRGLVAERVTVRLMTPQGTFSREFRPRYREVYPNGRRCPAACRQATVTFPLPA
ncbi:MAG: hypothetical protein KY467_18660 [Gemmatimonadetes bacterium]|nr:hypothetical protein [Gemmatimonadota bacterium]